MTPVFRNPAHLPHTAQLAPPPSLTLTAQVHLSAPLSHLSSCRPKPPARTRLHSRPRILQPPACAPLNAAQPRRSPVRPQPRPLLTVAEPPLPPCRASLRVGCRNRALPIPFEAAISFVGARGSPSATSRHLSTAARPISSSFGKLCHHLAIDSFPCCTPRSAN